VRKFPAPIVAAGIALGIVASLAACTSTPTTAADCTTGPQAGNSSNAIAATGDFGTKTDVTFPTPLIAKSVQVTDVTPGTGRVLADGDFADFQATIWVAETGEYLTGTSFVSTQPSRMDVGSDSDQLGPLLECAEVGSRIAAVSTLAQLFPDVDPAQAGIDADANLVVVVDVTGGFAGKADGVDQLPKSGFPSVVTAPNGTPGVTIPSSAAPTMLESAVLKQGDGDVVKEGDYVTFQYEGLIWDSPGSVFDSTWTDNAPTTTVASKYDDSTQAGVFPGTEGAIIGQKVGSQVIVIVPSDKSYSTAADAAAPDSVPASSTRIYVIDILSTATVS
jgi:peptidylprolyl isomerase